MKKRIISFRYAIQGIIHVFKTQPNFKIHTVAAFLAVLASMLLEIPGFEFALIVACIGLVLVAELINSAIEFTIDLVSPEYHKLAGAAKDAAAGAVLISALSALAVGIVILGPPLLEKLGL